MTTTVDRRVLNRTLLDRQRFHRPSDQGPLDTIEHLIGLQAQSPTAPYLGLFSRVGGFHQRQLSDLLVDRSAVRIVTMRSMVHLVSARDAIALRDWVQPALRRGLNTAWGPRLAGGPLSTRDLGVALNRKWTDAEPTALVNAARVLLPLVQVPPRGLWGRSGQTTYATVHGWLDADPAGRIGA